jgi:hypothetical protein
LVKFLWIVCYISFYLIRNEFIFFLIDLKNK